MLFGDYSPIIFSGVIVRYASCGMTCHQALRIIKLGQVEYPRWPPLLKIAKITKSVFSPELLDFFG